MRDPRLLISNLGAGRSRVLALVFASISTGAYGCASAAAPAASAAAPAANTPWPNCVAAAAAVRADSGPLEWWPYHNLAYCRDSAGAVASALWAHFPTDLQAANGVMFVSANVRDRRVLAALFATARDTLRPEHVRAAAVAVLHTYQNPSVVQRLVDTRGRWDIQLGLRTHGAQVAGAQLPGPESDAEIVAECRAVAATARPRSTLRHLADECSKRGREPERPVTTGAP